jgi:hypothetical protein
MLRIALIDILLFALPFLLYAAYMIWVKGKPANAMLKSAPLFWLLAAGFGLLFVVMATLVQFSGGDREGTYRPPTLEGGEINPGEID